MSPPTMLAVLPVRDGILPAGGAETIAEAEGHGLLVGSGVATAAHDLAGMVDEVHVLELGDFAPARWAKLLAPLVATHPVVILPASPDGRDLAPRLAHELGTPLLAGAVRVRPDQVSLARWGGLVLEDVTPDGPFVATLQPGVRGVEQHPHRDPGAVTAHRVNLADLADPDDRTSDPVVLEVLAPDMSTMDLAEAPRILGGGAGLDGRHRFEQLARLARTLDASVGATRVITDRGWISHSRQIGTTGVVVDPRLYLAFGISGAVQHTSGLGQPDHIVSVNTEPHCPMMQLADLAVVSDANQVLDALLVRLEGSADA
jgi:electron transfer flavoprotein alpha subunit